MIYKIMDVNHGGEIIARIETNHGKNALRVFRKSLLSAGCSEITKTKYGNWLLSTSHGAYYYAMPDKEAAEND